jgi:hypothetical protein
MLMGLLGMMPVILLRAFLVVRAGRRRLSLDGAARTRMKDERCDGLVRHAIVLAGTQAYREGVRRIDQRIDHQQSVMRRYVSAADRPS